MSDSVHESIVEHSNDGIFVAQDGEIVYANQRLCELTGYAPGELAGRAKLISSPPTTANWSRAIISPG
ncbi:PAS domain S-box protein [Halonotius sp. GCM10025705]|uniref:PAS domain S-box protein n=1 Tax=Halonotius sp. GCM10025705 TaxID=3252678 RepID=UPI00361B1880